MSKKLTSIAITHISLVKAGANGKDIIYKSNDKEPNYAKHIEIKKSDEEGVVYGIVYSPDEVDTDGDYTTSDEIKKAAYTFMKNKNTANVDKDHSFDIEKAYIAQSWIIKENDPTFPEQKEGSWAVAIQLEDDELIKAVKNGDIAGISMAGTATKEEDEPEITKADEKSFSLNDLLGVFTKIFSSTSVDIRGHVYNDKVEKKEEEESMKKEDLEDVVKTALEPLTKTISDLQSKVETLEKSNDETKEALKKSKQNNEPTPGQIEKDNTAGGIL